jgi:hypothetical protein
MNMKCVVLRRGEMLGNESVIADGMMASSKQWKSRVQSTCNMVIGVNKHSSHFVTDNSKFLIYVISWQETQPTSPTRNATMS